MKNITNGICMVPDCCGKWDLDFNILSVDSRYYPDNTIYINIMLLQNYNHPFSDNNNFDSEVEGITVMKHEIKGISRDDCEEQARAWINANAVKALKKAISILSPMTNKSLFKLLIQKLFRL